MTTAAAAARVARREAYEASLEDWRKSSTARSELGAAMRLAVVRLADPAPTAAPAVVYDWRIV